MATTSVHGGESALGDFLCRQSIPAAHRIASVSEADAVRVMTFTRTVLDVLYGNPGQLP